MISIYDEVVMRQLHQHTQMPVRHEEILPPPPPRKISRLSEDDTVTSAPDIS